MDSYSYIGIAVGTILLGIAYRKIKQCCQRQADAQQTKPTQVIYI